MLDGRNGVGLVFKPFGASGFGSGPGSPDKGLRPRNHPTPVPVTEARTRLPFHREGRASLTVTTGRQQDRQRGKCTPPRQLHLGANGLAKSIRSWGATPAESNRGADRVPGAA